MYSITNHIHSFLFTFICCAQLCALRPQKDDNFQFTTIFWLPNNFMLTNIQMLPILPPPNTCLTLHAFELWLCNCNASANRMTKVSYSTENVCVNIDFHTGFSLHTFTQLKAMNFDHQWCHTIHFCGNFFNFYFFRLCHSMRCDVRDFSVITDIRTYWRKNNLSQNNYCFIANKFSTRQIRVNGDKSRTRDRD